MTEKLLKKIQLIGGPGQLGSMLMEGSKLGDSYNSFQILKRKDKGEDFARFHPDYSFPAGWSTAMWQREVSYKKGGRPTVTELLMFCVSDSYIGQSAKAWPVIGPDKRLKELAQGLWCSVISLTHRCCIWCCRTKLKIGATGKSFKDQKWAWGKIWHKLRYGGGMSVLLQ